MSWQVACPYSWAYASTGCRNVPCSMPTSWISISSLWCHPKHQGSLNRSLHPHSWWSCTVVAGMSTACQWRYIENPLLQLQMEAWLVAVVVRVSADPLLRWCIAPTVLHERSVPWQRLGFSLHVHCVQWHLMPWWFSQGWDPHEICGYCFVELLLKIPLLREGCMHCTCSWRGYVNWLVSTVNMTCADIKIVTAILVAIIS